MTGAVRRIDKWLWYARFVKSRTGAARLVTDGKVITSRGPGTAMDFALQLIEILAGSDKRDEVEKALVRT